MLKHTHMYHLLVTVSLALLCSTPFTVLGECLAHNSGQDSSASGKNDSNSIKYILIDEASLDWAENVNDIVWPWPRELYSKIVDFCARGGARVVIFSFPLASQSMYGAGDDDMLLNSMRNGPTMVLSFDISETFIDSPHIKPVHAPFELPNSSLRTPLFSGALASIAQFWNMPHKPYHASVNRVGYRGPLLREGKSLHVYPVLSVEGAVIPSLGLAAYLADDIREGDDKLVIIGEHDMRIGEVCTPLDDHGRVSIDSSEHGYYQTISAAAIIQSQLRHEASISRATDIDPSFISNCYVFVSGTALESHEKLSTDLDLYIDGLFLDLLLRAKADKESGERGQPSN